MKNGKKFYASFGILIIGMVAVLLVLAHAHNYTNTMNDMGAVRGGVQRIAKLEMEGKPDDALIVHVENMLAQLQENEQNRRFTLPMTAVYRADLQAVHVLWIKLKAEIARVRAGEAPDNLLAISEDHFQISGKAVLSAQKCVQISARYRTIAGIVLILSITALMAVLEYHGRHKVKRIFCTDLLTGLSNSLFFEEQVASLLAGAAPKAYIMVYFNINNFKFVNESYGYPVGDRLLVEIGTALQHFCGKNEACSRNNADRFTLLLQNRPHVVETLSIAVNRAFHSEKEMSLSDLFTCSYGVYEITDANESAKSMLSKASRALKEGKSHDGIAYYDSYLLEKITRENRLTQAMRQAIVRDEFQIYLQPKIQLSSKKLVGAEVLCRWISAEIGFLPPDEFIPLFEKNGFIATLDFYMLEKACQEFNRIMQEQPLHPIPFSINFSRITLLQDDFLERFCGAIMRHNIQPAYIEIEVTESAFIMNEGIVIQKLEILKAKGHKIAMDDFGQAYSSLNLLRKLPIDVLKLDKEFLCEGATKKRTYAIIQCIIDMAASLNIQIVCEGVESDEHVRLLARMGCPIGQGYYFSKPISVEDFQSKYQRECVAE